MRTKSDFEYENIADNFVRKVLKDAGIELRTWDVPLQVIVKACPEAFSVALGKLIVSNGKLRKGVETFKDLMTNDPEFRIQSQNLATDLAAAEMIENFKEGLAA